MTSEAVVGAMRGFEPAFAVCEITVLNILKLVIEVVAIRKNHPTVYGYQESHPLLRRPDHEGEVFPPSPQLQDIGEGEG